MSVREFDFIVDQIPIFIQIDGKKIPARGASMSWKQAQNFVEEGKALLKKEGATGQEWLDRTLSVVAASLNRAGHEITEEQLQDQFDIPTLNEMNNMILFKSGLRASVNGDGAGEARAASIS